MDKERILPCLPNRVRRNYRGGAGIDRLRGKTSCTDSELSEDWLGSTTTAKNPGLPEIQGEGRSRVLRRDNSTPLLSEVIAEDPEFYLGRQWYEKHGLQTGFLAKLLDSSIRLHVQAHPSRQYAREHLNSDYGKFECYYILDARPDCEPYIRLGFQRSPGRDEFSRIVGTQDIATMDACFENIPVKPGDVWFVPAGMPHAIGPGLLMIEVMEPSDLVVRCEFVREGIHVPPEARFMGRDLESCLDIFDFRQVSPAEARANFCRQSRILIDTEQAKWELLLGSESNESFELYRLTLRGTFVLPLDGRFQLAIVTRGSAAIRDGHSSVTVPRGYSAFIAADIRLCEITGLTDTAEICFVRPLSRVNG